MGNSQSPPFFEKSKSDLFFEKVQKIIEKDKKDDILEIYSHEKSIQKYNFRLLWNFVTSQKSIFSEILNCLEWEDILKTRELEKSKKSIGLLCPSLPPSLPPGALLRLIDEQIFFLKAQVDPFYLGSFFRGLGVEKKNEKHYKNGEKNLKTTDETTKKSERIFEAKNPMPEGNEKVQIEHFSPKSTFTSSKPPKWMFLKTIELSRFPASAEEDGIAEKVLDFLVPPVPLEEVRRGLENCPRLETLKIGRYTFKVREGPLSQNDLFALQHALSRFCETSPQSSSLSPLSLDVISYNRAPPPAAPRFLPIDYLLVLWPDLQELTLKFNDPTPLPWGGGGPGGEGKSEILNFVSHAKRMREPVRNLKKMVFLISEKYRLADYLSFFSNLSEFLEFQLKSLVFLSFQVLPASPPSLLESISLRLNPLQKIFWTIFLKNSFFIRNSDLSNLEQGRAILLKLDFFKEFLGFSKTQLGGEKTGNSSHFWKFFNAHSEAGTLPSCFKKNDFIENISKNTNNLQPFFAEKKDKKRFLSVKSFHHHLHPELSTQEAILFFQKINSFNFPALSSLRVSWFPPLPTPPEKISFLTSAAGRDKDWDVENSKKSDFLDEKSINLEFLSSLLPPEFQGRVESCREFRRGDCSIAEWTFS